MKFVLLSLAIILAFCLSVESQDDRSQRVVSAFNEAVTTMRPEWDEPAGLWYRLRESLQSDPPVYVKSLDRKIIVDELIKLHERRLQALRKMRAAEWQN